MKRRRPKHPLRIALRVLFFVFLGGVSTVFVAWGVEWGFSPRSPFLKHASHFVQDDHFGRRLWQWQLDRYEVTWDPEDLLPGTRAGILDLEVPQETLPRWARRPPARVDEPIVHSEYHAIGLPYRALFRVKHVYILAEMDDGVAETTFSRVQVQGIVETGIGYRDPGPSWVAGQAKLGLPIIPIPLGLIVNSTIWAGTWWLGVNIVSLTRQRVRSLRGLCPRCAYDLDGLTTCPECGNQPR